jgi:hypothetical protein
LVISRFGLGNKAAIIPVEADEPHIQIGRKINQFTRSLTKTFIPDFWLP